MMVLQALAFYALFFALALCVGVAIVMVLVIVIIAQAFYCGGRLAWRVVMDWKPT